MELARPPEAQAAGVSAAPLRSARPLSRELVEAKRKGQYWQSMHARAKQRIAVWEGRHAAQQGELSEAQREIEQLQERVRQLERENEALKQRNQDLLRTPFGQRSEKRAAGSEAAAEAPARAPAGAAAEPSAPRRRGGQRGAAAHRRVDRCALAVHEECHQPETQSRVCADCGQPYHANGEQVSERIEVQVQGYVRRIRRRRFRAACDCAQRQGETAPEVIAALPPRLFRGSLYGLSVWVEFVLHVYWQRRPARSFEREWGERGVALRASTLLGHLRDLLTWFEPLEAALAVHQQQARLAHGDETSWVVHVRAEQGRNARCWLWACRTADAVRFRVDPARSAAAAQALFGQLGQSAPVVLVCDRYAAYVKLARECAGQFVLAICWAHARRDFVTLGRTRPELEAWAGRIVQRMGQLYRLNARRLRLWQVRYEQCLEGQSEQFGAAQRALEAACAELFEQAAQELAELTAAGQPAAGAEADPRLGPLQALVRHREGLSVFLQRPFVPLDNNAVERKFRRPVIGRKLSFGSHSEDGAALQGTLLSVLATLELAGLDLRLWLTAFLGECAQIGRAAVVADPQAWLPWGMSAQRLQALRAAGRALPPEPDP